MRCSYPRVESGHVVLLSVLACCSAMAQTAPHPPSAALQAYVAAKSPDPGRDSDWTNARFRAVALPGPVLDRYPIGLQKLGEGQPQSDQPWYLYVTLIVFAAALPVHHYRRRAQSMEGHLDVLLEERNRIARECHDTLMASFAAISWQLEATAKLFRDNNLDSTPAARSCELARTMVFHSQAEARRIICDLRDTDEVTKVLSRALARTLDADHLRQSVATTLDVEGDELSLAPGCVHHLVCISQEAVTNAIRHAQPTRINVRLKYESDALSLSINDNGRGFHASDPSAPRHGHFGIQGMEERTRKLGGTFRLRTMIGAGTEVTVRVPIRAMQEAVQQQHHIMRWNGI